MNLAKFLEQQKIAARKSVEREVTAFMERHPRCDNVRRKKMASLLARGSAVSLKHAYRLTAAKRS